MMENKISGVPAVDGEGKMVGIITESDILRLIVDRWDELFEYET
ncbi:MAG: CBS domain-containing protein [Anaerolineae bacterium]|jgi:CBS domain-containing protein